jgi:hypothetical protein
MSTLTPFPRDQRRHVLRRRRQKDVAAALTAAHGGKAHKIAVERAARATRAGRAGAAASWAQISRDILAGAGRGMEAREAVAAVDRPAPQEGLEMMKVFVEIPCYLRRRTLIDVARHLAG